VERPRLLLVPQFTELEWSIAPQLSEWAEVATFDIPGVGAEPMPEFDPQPLTSELLAQRTRESIVQRGLQELDAHGWGTYFLVADGSGNANALRIARSRPEAVVGVALGHASLSYDTEGERAPRNREVYAALTQLLRNDYDSFVRHGITQMTQGSYDEQLAQQMVERFPSMELTARVWDALSSQHEPIGEMLHELEKPLLLGKHDGCIGFTPEGYEDAVAAFPDAQTVSTPKACCTDPGFADALLAFCERVAG
jgi:hypothetical protein